MWSKYNGRNVRDELFGKSVLQLSQGKEERSDKASCDERDDADARAEACKVWTKGCATRVLRYVREESACGKCEHSGRAKVEVWTVWDVDILGDF